MQFQDKTNAGIAAMLVLSLALATGSAWNAREAGKNMHSLLDGPLAAERLVSEWAGKIESNVKRSTMLVQSGDPVLVKHFAGDVAASSSQNTELMNKVQGSLGTEEEKLLFARIAENRKAYQSSRETAFRLAAEGRGKAAYQALAAQYTAIATRYQDMVAQLVEVERRQLNEEAQQAARAEAVGRNVAIAMIALALLAAAFAAWRLFARARQMAAATQTAGTEPAGKWDEFYDILA